MAIPFAPSSKPKPFTVPSVINKVQAVFNPFPDTRKTATSNNLKYAVKDAARVPLVFFSPQVHHFWVIKFVRKISAKRITHNLSSVCINFPVRVKSVIDPMPVPPDPK